MNIAELPFHQLVRVAGRAFDGDLTDRALNARLHLAKQELSAVCRPAVGAQISEIF